MVETAAALGDVGERVIVMTGALNPARFIDSDAVFNIGCAVGAVQALTPGVWIVMNGRVWKPVNVSKYHKAHRFDANFTSAYHHDCFHAHSDIHMANTRYAVL